MTTAINNASPELVQAANELVNNVFYGTLLRRFRDAQQPTVFDSGTGGGTFQRMLDTEFIKRISQQGVSPVAKPLIRHLSKTTNNINTLRQSGTTIPNTASSALRQVRQGTDNG